MAKLPTSKTASTGPSSPKKASSRKYGVVGKLSDGVIILTPKSKPKHFTSRQIRSTIREVRENSKADRLEEVRGRRG